MPKTENKSKLVVIALGILLVLIIILLKHFGQDRSRKVLFPSQLPPSTLSKDNGELPPKHSTPVPVLPTPLSLERIDRLKEEYMAVVIYQRKQLGKVYLHVLDKIYVLNPVYLTTIESDPKWPGAHFLLDLNAFQNQRSRFQEVLSGSAALIDAQLDRLNRQIIDLIPVAIRGGEDYESERKMILKDLQTLDELVLQYAEIEFLIN